MRLADPARDPRGDDARGEGVPAEVGSIAALDEQRWNERLLAAPLAVPGVRTWRYREPAVVLGRAQRALAASLRRDRADDAGGALPLVERLAGGGAVLVGPWMIGLSVALPHAHRLVAGRSIAASYDWLGEVFVDLLAARGVDARVATAADARKAAAPLAWACFAGVTAGEVLVDGRKLVGFAQRRNRHGVLLVAGMLLDAVPWAALCAAVVGDRTAAERLRCAAALAETTIDLATARDRRRVASGDAVVGPRRDAEAGSTPERGNDVAAELAHAVGCCVDPPSPASPAPGAPVYA
ncbi:MAG: biotin/lipoate A/B protein ligase family protein [Lautropia sp.]